MVLLRAPSVLQGDVHGQYWLGAVRDREDPKNWRWISGKPVCTQQDWYRELLSASGTHFDVLNPLPGLPHFFPSGLGVVLEPARRQRQLRPVRRDQGLAVVGHQLQAQPQLYMPTQ